MGNLVELADHGDKGAKMILFFARVAYHHVLDAQLEAIRGQLRWYGIRPEEITGLLFLDFNQAIRRLYRRDIPANNAEQYIMLGMRHTVNKYRREVSSDILPPRTTAKRRKKKGLDDGRLRRARRLDETKAFEDLASGPIVLARIHQVGAGWETAVISGYEMA